MRARNSLLSTSMLMLLSSIVIVPSVSAQNSNLKPSSLSIAKLDDKTAAISARFSTATIRDKKVGILIDKETVTLVDDGTSGDLRGGDGLFTAKVDFDFDAFTKANAQLVQATSEGKTNLFAPGGRQQIKQQRVAINGKSMEFIGFSNGKEQVFTLPFDPSSIKVDQPIALPLVNLPIGLPIDFDPVPAAAVSIPQSLMITDVMGQGVNYVTGDYSRGASGFWVENGVIQYPVEEITIAGNMRDMFQQIVSIGSDTLTRGTKTTGSILIDGMTVAGS